jgi:hypothetical protein
VIQCRAPRAWALLTAFLALQLVATTLSAAPPKAVAAAPSQNGHPFRVYDMLVFRHKPDLRGLGMLPATGSGNFWSFAQSPRDKVDEAAIQREIAHFRDFPGLFYIDIEAWRVYDIPDRQIDENIAKLGRVADIVRETAPKLQFGFYAVLPENVYWPLVDGTPDQLLRWRESARRTEVLARKVDFIMPSLYTFYDSESDRAGWAKWARIVLTEARRYGKPVYPFIWPQFHNSNEKLGGHPVPGDYWRMELEIVRQYADGVVIWGGDSTDWDENAAWWQQTKQFLATLK